MRGGNTSLKASLNRSNIVSKAECEFGDGLQTEEYIFWDCKRYGEQRTTMKDILSENSKKAYPHKVSYRALKARRKRFLQGVCSFINNIPIFI
jgi:hypothetical protein